MTQFEYRQSPADPRLIEIRRRPLHGGRPSLWRRYMLRESAEAAISLLEILQEPQEQEQEQDMVSE